jgi:hypothetical protein
VKSFTTTHGHTAFTYEKTLIILGFPPAGFCAMLPDSFGFDYC